MSQRAMSIPLERTGQDRAAPVKRMPVNRLPVVHHAARVLAHQVRLDLLDGRGDGQGAPLDDRLPQADDPGVGVNLQEEPPRLDQKGLQLRDLEPILGADRRVASDTRLGIGLGPIERGPAQRRKGAGQDRTTAHSHLEYRAACASLILLQWTAAGCHWLVASNRRRTPLY